MNILLISGTGCIGSSLGLLLSKDNYVYVTSREKHISGENINYLMGNIRDKEFRDRIFKERKYDVIVDFSFYTLSEFSEVVPFLTNNTNQYIFLSSARVYDDSLVITEESKLLVQNNIYDLDDNSYAFVKAYEENLLRRLPNWTIVRPYITYNYNRLQLAMYEKDEWLIPILNNKPIIIPKRVLECTTTMTYSVDVSKRIAAIISNKNTKYEVYQIASNERITWKQILDIYINVIKEKTGIDPHVLITYYDDYIPKYFDKNKYYGDRLFNRLFNSEKVDNLLNDSKYTPVIEGLNICLGKSIDEEIWKIRKKPINNEWEAYKKKIVDFGEYNIYQEWDKVSSYGKRKIICFGAGQRLRETIKTLKQRFEILYVIDNNELLTREYIDDIEIVGSEMLKKNKEYLYVITVDDGKRAIDMVSQLLNSEIYRFEHLRNII